MMERGYLVSGRYEILDTLGEGGMANVYLAEDTILHRQVAVKVLRMDLQHDQATIRRFQREASATCELSHPNIVSVYDVGEDRGIQYIVMEYIAGSNLKAYIEKHYPFPLTKVIEIMIQILSAVQLAHSKGIIHRDLKPQNILMTEDGQSKIADFGIAVALSEESVTQTNSMLGSVHYISPEQARGSLPTPQSDIYALGIILYELLVGKVPFAGDSAVTIALKHFHEDIPSIRETNPVIPQALENVVLKATAKDPKQRFQSADEMSASLRTSLDPARRNEPKFVPIVDQDLLGETKIMPSHLDDTRPIPKTNHATQSATSAPAEEVAPPEKLPKPKRKMRWPLLVGIGVLLIAVIGIFVALIVTNRDVKVPDMSGMTQSEARAALEKSDLELGTLRYEYSQKVAKDLVIRSLPVESSSVKNGSKVGLVISEGAKTYTIGNYKGKNYDTVAEKLGNLGLFVKRKEQTSETVPAGEIIKQSLKKGKKVVPKDTTITLTVSTGLPTMVLEDYRNQDYETVAALLRQKGLTVVKKTTSSTTVDTGKIVEQSPAAGEEVVASETTITLTVSTGRPNVELADMVAGKYNQEKAKSYADEHNLKLVVENDYSDTVASGLVMSQSPTAGTAMKSGDTLTVTLSKGSDPNKETSFSKTITIPYLAASQSSSSNTSSSATNTVQVYIGDAKNNINSLYQTLTISHDTSLTLHFTVKDNQSAQYRIVRDGTQIAQESVSN